MQRFRTERFCLTAFTPLATGFVLLAAGLGGATSRAGEPPILLENQQVLLQIDPVFGAIARIVDKPGGIELAPAPAVAENYRLVLLMPDRKTATILGKEQRLSRTRRAADGLVLDWDGPLTDTAGAKHKIAVRMEIKAAGEGLEFALHVDNGSTLKLGDACYPMIGGLGRFGAPGKPADGVAWVPTSTPWTKKIEMPFGAATFAYPGQANMSFACIQSAAARRSLYFASHDKIARYKVYHFEENSKDVFAWIQHTPFAPPGGAFDGSSVVLRFVDGDWQAAGRVYRAWFERTFGITKPAQCWLRRESFFQFTMFELPEGTINYRFKDIPRWAQDAKDHGINAVQISGWHLGGHDNGYPHYVVDPRLGTWEQLEEGIRACHRMGLKVYFFVNYQQMMLDTEWYKKELVKYREQGPNGEVTWNTGWGMGTLWARMGHPKLMTAADPAFPQFRKIIVEQFARLAQIGADGMHVDKMFPAAIDYNPDIPLSPDTATWEGAILLTQEIFAACRKYNPDWAMSFECNWDRLLQFSGATWWVGNQRITRRIFPENAETLAIESPYDYLGVNNAVREGHTVLVGPLNFCRSVGWKPWEGLAEYIREVKRIQDSLLDTVYLGEVLGHEGVEMPAVVVEYNVFRNLCTGSRAMILTNATLQPRKQPFAAFRASPSGKVRIHTPFQPSRVVNLPAEIEVPAERIVFVEELSAGPTTTCGAGVSPAHAAGTAAPQKRGINDGQELIAAGGSETAETKQSIRLEDDRYLVEASRAHGAITRILDKKGGLELIREPRLADNFRFSLPIPGKEPWQTIEANTIWGKDQKLSSFEAGARKLALRWNKPLLNYLGEKFEASAAMDIELTQNGVLLGLKIDNATPYRIAEVYFPQLGGLQGIGKSAEQLKSSQLIRPTGPDAVASTDIFRVFTNMSWLGDQGAEQFYAYPKDVPKPWYEVYAPSLNRSVHLGADNRDGRPRVLRLELLPGNSATEREDGNWPRPSDLRGESVGVSACFVDFADAPLNKTYEAAATLISFHDGDWREAKKMRKP